MLKRAYDYFFTRPNIVSKLYENDFYTTIKTMLESPVMVKYVFTKSGKRRRKGVILAYCEGNEIHVGASLVKFSEGDRFNRNEGLWRAYEEAVPLKDFDSEQFPHSIQNDVELMKNRAIRYYKQANTIAVEE